MTPLLILMASVFLAWLLLGRQSIRTQPVGLLESDEHNASPLQELVASRLQALSMTLRVEHELRGVPGVIEIPESPLPKNLVSTLYAEKDGVFFTAHLSPDQQRLATLTLEVALDVDAPLPETSLLSFRRVVQHDGVAVCPEVHSLTFDLWPQLEFQRDHAGLLSRDMRDQWRHFDVGFPEVVFDLKQGAVSIELRDVDAQALDAFLPEHWIQQLRDITLQPPSVSFAELLPLQDVPLSEQLATLSSLSGWWSQGKEESKTFHTRVCELLSHDPPPPLLEVEEVLASWRNVPTTLPSLLWMVRALDASPDLEANTLFAPLERMLATTNPLPEHSGLEAFARTSGLWEKVPTELSLWLIPWAPSPTGLPTMLQASPGQHPAFWRGALSLAEREDLSPADRAALGAHVCAEDDVEASTTLTMLGLSPALARSEHALRTASSLRSDHIHAITVLGEEGQAPQLELLGMLQSSRAPRVVRQALANAYDSLAASLTVGGLTLDVGDEWRGSLRQVQATEGNLSIHEEEEDPFL